MLLLTLIVINFDSFAQIQKTFFYSDSAGIKNIANLIIENSKNKYQLDRVFNQKTNVEYWYCHGQHTLITIHFQVFPDKSTRPFILKGLTGNYEDIFPFWKKYFQEDADSAVIQKAGAVKSPALGFLKGEIVYRFHRGGSVWQISPYSLVDPDKKTNH